MGQYDNRKIHQIDPQTGAVLRTIESNRLVTGVTWVDGELWHGTWEENDESDVRRIDPKTGEVLESLEMPTGVWVFQGSSPIVTTGFFVAAEAVEKSERSANQDAPQRWRPRRNITIWIQKKCSIYLCRNLPARHYRDPVQALQIIDESH